MSVTISVALETVNDEMDTYAQISLESASAVDGSYSIVTTTLLVADQVYYELTDSAGTINTWYRWRLRNTLLTVSSGYSNPFRPAGATRLKIRQQAINDYQSGRVLASTAGGTTTSILTLDPFVKSSIYTNTARGKGGWIFVSGGTYIGNKTRITGMTGSTGAIGVNPSLTHLLDDGEEFEWHWLVGPDEWNEAINRAMTRYRVFARVPIAGAGTAEISLADVPGLTTKRQIVGVWWYPDVSDTGISGVDVPWGTDGKWWSARGEDGNVTLQTSPAIATGDTVYMDYLLEMPEVYTDDSVLPSAINLRLAAALAYDEVLAALSNEANGGSVQDRKTFESRRAKHQPGLAEMFRRYGSTAKWQPPQLAEAPIGPQFWRAR